MGRKKNRQLAISTGLAAVLFALTGCDITTTEQIIERVPSVTRLPGRDADEATPPGVDAPEAGLGEMERYVHSRINEIRQQEGLDPLQYNAELAAVARSYSQRMAEEDFFAHVSPDGSTPAERVEAAGLLYWIVGENLFTSTNAPEPAPLAVQGWLDSPGHRENILRSVFSETGIGVWQDGNTYYFTQLFMRPL
ncbi:CAP domain-containing protein [Oculatella sp. LEGE 06141]|uniref:CAP domain-containing protein n=1 Tax=Oculatella sp. LEGE 06141 TaxID=1828648 RepID=UPI0018804400|nr:CAP domain-containing protein [Oculatella sp. LEGE 06141]MBE9179148.1 CAP domain-containing protein [Oculatella sp. LEGE 06141]